MATDETTSKAVQASSSPERPATAAQQRATQHQGTTDTDVLVSDIEQTRKELASTIDEIVDRVSPKKVVERTKLQAAEAAKQGVHDATVLVKEAAGVVREKAATAGELLKERTGPATEAVKGAAATVKDKVGGAGDTPADRSALVGATSVAVSSATPVATTGPSGGDAPTAAYQSVRSPLPAGTVSVEAGAVPPPEPVDTSGSLADAAEAAGPSVEPAGADVPSYAPVRTQGSAPSPSPVPVLAGAGVAAVVALLLLLLRRRSR